MALQVVSISRASQTIKKRWCRFTLQALLITVTLLGICIGLLTRQVHREQKAVAAIREKGGVIEYAHQWDVVDDRFVMMRRIVPNARPPGPEWLRNFIGDGYFIEVVSIDLTDAPITDDDLKYVQVFRSLRCLSLGGTSVSDAGIAHLRSLKQLQTLSLYRTRVTRQSMAVLKEMPDLRYLDVSETQLVSGSDYGSRLASLNATRAALPNVWIP